MPHKSMIYVMKTPGVCSTCLQTAQQRRCHGARCSTAGQCWSVALFLAPREQLALHADERSLHTVTVLGQWSKKLLLVR